MLKPGEPGPRRRALLAALAAARVRFQPGTEPPAVTLVKRWLDTWSSIGVIAAGMARQGYDLQLARYGDEGWRATFYVAGREHSPNAGDGQRVGADSVAGGAGGGLGDAGEAVGTVTALASRRPSRAD